LARGNVRSEFETVPKPRDRLDSRRSTLRRVSFFRREGREAPVILRQDDFARVGASGSILLAGRMQSFRGYFIFKRYFISQCFNRKRS